MKRTSVSGRLANTTDSSNTSYIPAGALAVNFVDQTVYTSDGTNLIQVGSNVTNLNVTSTLTVNGASINATSFSGTANNALNLAGQPASYYTNATNITTGTLNPARLALSGVVANTYGNASSIPVITVDSAGRVTTVSTSAVAGVTGFNYYSGNSTITLTTGDGSTYTATINQANSTVSGLVEIVDSTSNTSSTVAASANSVHVAYIASQNAYSNSISYITSGITNGSIVIANAVYSQNSGALGGKSLTTVESEITSNAATAYANSTSYTDGKIATVNSAITGNSSTAYTNAVNYVANGITNGSIVAANATYSSNSGQLSGTSLSTLQSQITSNASAAYSNAVANAAYMAGQSYANAVASAASLYLPLTGGTINGPLTITGNVVMAGNTTFVNTSVISTTDKAIYLSANSPSSLLSDGSGIVVTNAASFLYSDAAHGWQANVNVVPSSNSVYNLGSSGLYWNYAYANTGNFNTLNVSGNVNISNSAITNTGIIAFSTSTIISPVLGQMWWDGGSTLNLGMSNNVTQKIGESQYFYVKASSAITLGQLVMFTGTVGASGVITAAPSTGITDGSLIVGVAAESIPTNGFGMIQNFGILKGFDTTGSSAGETWTDGTFLYYNPNVTGGFTKNEPSSPTPKTLIAAVINAGSGGSGSIVIRITDYPSISDIQEVQLANTANGQVLVYSASSNTWQNQNSNILSANSATYLGNTAGTLANVSSWVTGNSATSYSNAVVNAAYVAGVAYANAVAFAANASNITTGTLPYAQLPANVVIWSNNNIFSGIETFNANVSLASGNGTNQLLINTINATSSGLLANSTVLTLGNSSVNVVVNATSFSGTSNNSLNLGGATLSTIQTQITGNSATAYSNATSYTDGRISTANSAITGNSSTAYTNAVNYVANSVTNGTIVAANAVYAQNAGTLSSVTLATLQSQITGNSATAYTNAVSNAAALYQTTAGLAANVATLASNNSTYFGGYTWGSPPSLGSTAANSANFTTANATTLSVGSSFIANSSVLKSTGLANISGNAVFGSTMTIGGTAVSAAAWTTNGIGLIQNATTYTDTSTAASGTVTTAYMNLLGAQTYAATNASVTVSALYGTYFQNPVRGTNVSGTSTYALGVDSFVSAGSATFNGALQAYSQLTLTGTTGNLTAGFATAATNSGSTKTVNIGTGSLSGATSTITIGSSVSGATQTTTVNGRITFAPVGATLAAWSTNGVGLIQSAATFTDNTTAASGTVTTAYMNLFDTETYAATNAITVTNIYGTYFKNPARGTNVSGSSNLYAIGADNALLVALTVSGGTFNATGVINITGPNGSTTANYSTSATTSGSTKTVNIGTAGLSGSTTTISIGSAVSGATSTTTLNGSTIATGTIQLAAYTVATLPTAGTAGRRAYVTDATVPTFLGTLTGGGSVKTPVFDNGTAWVAG